MELRTCASQILLKNKKAKGKKLIKMWIIPDSATKVVVPRTKKKLNLNLNQMGCQQYLNHQLFPERFLQKDLQYIHNEGAQGS